MTQGSLTYRFIYLFVVYLLFNLLLYVACALWATPGHPVHGGWVSLYRHCTQDVQGALVALFKHW